jgi:hypothetical protein
LGAPFGDYVLVGYAVDCERAEIRMRAKCPFDLERPMTEIAFDGVVAYDFEHDPFGTILSYVIESPLDDFVRANASQFAEGARLAGWAPFWTGDVSETVTSLRARDVHAYQVTAAIGLHGWVLAKSFDTRTI